MILAVLAQMAEMENRRITERIEHGRERARKALKETGRTHRGKASLGRPAKVNPKEVAGWRKENRASISATARHFDISPATVSRACASA